jgi:hypothetical protein
MYVKITYKGKLADGRVVGGSGVLPLTWAAGAHAPQTLATGKMYLK